jgi:hypothetical protein
MTLNREELLRDSQATLREIAGILCDLWALQGVGAYEDPTAGRGRRPSGQEDDLFPLLTTTHREVQALREGIGVLQDLLPYAIVEAGCRPPVGLRSENPIVEWPTRASEILNEIQGRLDRLAHEFEYQGVSPE